MTHAGWKDVLNLALGLIARQPAPAQIFIYLMLAFTVLMIAEGLRANFFPWRPVVPRRAKRVQPTNAVETMSPPQAQAAPAKREARLQISIARHVKRPTEGIRRQKPMRPQIRRMPSVVPPELPDASHVFTPVNEDAPNLEMLVPVAPVAATGEV